MNRNGSAFERLAEITHVAFDKTGTLTLGQPGVISAPDVDRNAGLIKALSDRSSHPVALALANAFDTVEPETLTKMREVPSQGVEAVHDGKRVRLGRPEWVSKIAEKTADLADRAGVAFTVEGKAASLFQLEDQLRPDAPATIAALKRAGVAAEILSGDHIKAVADVAREVQVEHFYGRMTPAEKIRHIQEQQLVGHRVLMVGDGLNDAPALAAAHVSMALKTGQLIRQNFALALFYNCLAIPLAVTGFITPLIAAIAMSTSSIVVIANSMRLNLFKEPKLEQVALGRNR